MSPSTAIIIGGGNRGQIFASYADVYPDTVQVVGLAEPVIEKQNAFARYNIPKENIVSTWQDLAMREKFADIAIICTLDTMHKEPTIEFARKGYHILLEKPMAATLSDVEEISAVIKETGVMFSVGHVLRYLSAFETMKSMISDGKIGKVCHISHTEHVGYWHFAHSFVRGNWHNEKESSFILLAKCCHDVDLIHYWMSGAKCLRVSSFGGLSHFRKEDKPPNAGTRCMSCPVEPECAYSAKRFYFNNLHEGIDEWPLNTFLLNPTKQRLTEALSTGPYGKCVFDGDNDVMSNQVVNFEYEGGRTATLNMVAYSGDSYRSSRIFGTKGYKTEALKTTLEVLKHRIGHWLVQFYCMPNSVLKNFQNGFKSFSFVRCENCELKYNMNEGRIIHRDFLTRKTNTIIPPAAPNNAMTRVAHHGGADFNLFHSFVSAVRTGDRSLIHTDVEDTRISHSLVFAAERARKEKRVVEIDF